MMKPDAPQKNRSTSRGKLLNFMSRKNNGQKERTQTSESDNFEFNDNLNNSNASSNPRK